MKFTIKATIPKTLLDRFNLGTTEEREAIADYICDALYDYISEVVDNGED